MIRPATPADLPHLVVLIRALAAHHADDATVTETSLARDLFGPHPWLHMLVASDDAKLTGYVALTQLARLQWGQRGIDIHHLYVSEGHRGAGLGAGLVAAAIDFARAQDCSYITVSALETNTEAQAFYAKHGFTDAPVQGRRFALSLR
ncbi:MAG: GNAT family N-acetyltransferase [Cypionkella sp.]